jgi:hypothetical protein
VETAWAMKLTLLTVHEVRFLSDLQMAPHGRLFLEWS